ncbi:cytochrome P450 [Lophiotrema nucula]|uniref:Cytochrome P450 n=1 Tax=Lophiotrema nucula TaxID=690887 RepID=A0A6A5Z0U9_9PLEO|nr:cytochrome P450 [Lophiotrema nucula]
MERPAPLTSFLTIIFSSILLYPIARWFLTTRRPSNFPPGPRTLPGLGNWHQIPRLWSHFKLDEWAREYGPIMGLKMGPTNIVILNDASLVYDLFVKRATSFNDRQTPYIAEHHILPEARQSYSLYMNNDYNSRLRTMTKNTLVGSGLANLVPAQKASATKVLWKLFQDPGEWSEHLKPWALASPVALMSGAPIEDFVQDYGKQWIDDYYLSQQLWIELLDPLDPPVDILPVLRWVPAWLAHWKRKAPVARKYLLNAYHGLVDQGKKSMKRHGGSFSQLALIPKWLRQQESGVTPADELDFTVFMGGLFDASAGSTYMSLQTLILALAAHPQFQRKAQAEIDGVFGESIPDKIDLAKLPYLNACVSESQRWRPLGAYVLGAFGLPRKVGQDEEVLGYQIPKGSLVMLNQWSIAHDPEFYDTPAEYNPERFFRDPVGAKEGVSQVGRKAVYTFGAGRRECLGKEFYFQNARIAMSQVLWAFDIVPDGPLDTDVTTGFTPAVVMMPKPFKVKFVPRRSEGALLEAKLAADNAMREILGQ